MAWGMEVRDPESYTNQDAFPEIPYSVYKWQAIKDTWANGATGHLKRFLRDYNDDRDADHLISKDEANSVGKDLGLSYDKDISELHLYEDYYDKYKSVQRAKALEDAPNQTALGIWSFMAGMADPVNIAVMAATAGAMYFTGGLASAGVPGMYAVIGDTLIQHGLNGAIPEAIIQATNREQGEPTNYWDIATAGAQTAALGLAFTGAGNMLKRGLKFNAQHAGETKLLEAPKKKLTYQEGFDSIRDKIDNPEDIPPQPPVPPVGHQLDLYTRKYKPKNVGPNGIINEGPMKGFTLEEADNIMDTSVNIMEDGLHPKPSDLVDDIDRYQYTGDSNEFTDHMNAEELDNVKQTRDFILAGSKAVIKNLRISKIEDAKSKILKHLEELGVDDSILKRVKMSKKANLRSLYKSIRRELTLDPIIENLKKFMPEEFFTHFNRAEIEAFAEKFTDKAETVYDPLDPMFPESIDEVKGRAPEVSGKSEFIKKQAAVDTLENKMDPSKNSFHRTDDEFKVSRDDTKDEDQLYEEYEAMTNKNLENFQDTLKGEEDAPIKEMLEEEKTSRDNLNSDKVLNAKKKYIKDFINCLRGNI